MQVSICVCASPGQGPPTAQSWLGIGLNETVSQSQVRRRCGESRPLLHRKGLLFIARQSWLYQAAPPGATQRARGIAQAVTKYSWLCNYTSNPPSRVALIWLGIVCSSIYGLGAQQANWVLIEAISQARYHTIVARTKTRLIAENITVKILCSSE